MTNVIRPAVAADLARIAEIIITNYRLNFYPIFRDDAFYFGVLTVPAQMEVYREALGSLWVYDDGVVKGVLHAEGQEVKKLFVEPVLQGQGIGAALLEFAVQNYSANTLWALEKNVRAIAFYERHGFHITEDRKPEEDTDEYLVRMARGK
ncbi:MAG: GNAT family N-acetyltransferase [Ruminococcaceae bacterium]|nr:GNAT family N-acetyltransferase [Oscillospiraceae bacterium]